MRPLQLCLIFLASYGFPISPSTAQRSRAPSPAGKEGVKRCFPECAVRLAPTQGGLWSPGKAEAAARSSLRAQGSSPPAGDRGAGPEKAPPAPRAHPTAALTTSHPPAPLFHQQAPSLQLSPFPVVAHLEGLVLISVISPLPAQPD